MCSICNPYQLSQYTTADCPIINQREQSFKHSSNSVSEGPFIFWEGRWEGEFSFQVYESSTCKVFFPVFWYHPNFPSKFKWLAATWIYLWLTQCQSTEYKISNKLEHKWLNNNNKKNTLLISVNVRSNRGPLFLRHRTWRRDCEFYVVIRAIRRPSPHPPALQALCRLVLYRPTKLILPRLLGPPLYRNQEKISSLDRNLLHNSEILMSGLTHLYFIRTHTDNKSNGHKYICNHALSIFNS